MLTSPGADRLATNGWLAHVPGEFRARVLERSSLRTFAKNEAIYRIGDPPGGIYGVVSGSVGVGIASSRRGSTFAHVGQPGFWFGEGCVVTRQPRRVEVWAMREVVAVHASLKTLDAMIADDPETWRWIALLTILNFDTTAGGADDLMIRDARKRCVAVLVRLATTVEPIRTTDNVVEVHVSQDELADMAVVSRGFVNAFLRDCEDQQLLEVGYRRIRINDLAQLRGLADAAD